MLPSVEIAVLGPVEVRVDGAPVDLGTPKQRALVAALALSHGRPVSVDAIVDLLWEDARRPGVTATLQAYVSGLRKVLEPRPGAAGPGDRAGDGRTGLRAAPAAGGARTPTRFEQVVTAEHRRLTMPLLGPRPLPGVGAARGRWSGSTRRSRSWRGTPYAELEDAPAAVAERAHLEELRSVALEDRAVARLALGRPRHRPPPSWRR